MIYKGHHLVHLIKMVMSSVISFMKYISEFIPQIDYLLTFKNGTASDMAITIGFNIGSASIVHKQFHRGEIISHFIFRTTLPGS